MVEELDRPYVLDLLDYNRRCLLHGLLQIYGWCQDEDYSPIQFLYSHKRPMWNNVDNIPPFIPQAAHGRSGNVTFPTSSVNMPAPIPAGRQTGPAPVYAGTPVPAGRQNRPAPVHADRPFPAGRRNSVSVSAVVPIDAGWTLILLVSLLFLLTEQLLLLVVHGSCCWFDVPTGSSVVPADRLIFLLVVSCSYWLTTFPAGFEGY
ncbi:hypothetical protein Tco_0825177 [Tanacetum coccineum]